MHAVHLGILIVVSLLAPISVYAAPSACDYLIEGVTLDDSLEKAREIWKSRGFTEIERAKIGGIYTSPPTFKRNAETLTYRENNRGIEINYRDTLVNVKSSREQWAMEAMKRTKAAYEKFCPGGTVVSLREHRCPRIQSDGSFRQPLTISVHPSGENVCHYKLYLRNGISETLRRVVMVTAPKKNAKVRKKKHLSTY